MPFVIALLALLLITLVFLLMLSKEKKEKIGLFYIVAHKFRSPISIIKWYVELLEDKSVGTLNDKQKEYSTKIYNASEELNAAVDYLLILLQLASNKLFIKKQPVDIKNLMEGVVSKLQFKIEKRKLHLQEFYPKDKEITVQTDPKLLNIVFQNIVNSVIKYAPENGNIDIKADFLNNKLLIEIKDNGCGTLKERMSGILSNPIGPSDMSFSFHPVEHLLKKLGGKISFRSQKDKGTTSSIFLPV